MPSPSPHDPLETLLEKWRSTPAPSSSPLQAEVWRRIAQRAPQHDWRARLETAFARPSFAAAFVAACVCFGLFIAESRVSTRRAELSLRVAHAYARLVDPLQPPPIAAAEAGEQTPP